MAFVFLEKHMGNEAPLRVKIVVPTFPLAVQWAFSMENICTFSIFHVALSFAPVAPLFLNLSYQRQALNHIVSSRISCPKSLVERLSFPTQVLVLCERIHLAEKACQILSAKYPNQVGRYYSEFNRQARKNALERFHDGNQRILISCRALDKVIDVPDASVGIILSCSSVNRQRIQRLGRILRRQDGGKLLPASIISIYGNPQRTVYSSHSLRLSVRIATRQFVISPTTLKTACFSILLMKISPKPCWKIWH